MIISTLHCGFHHCSPRRALSHTRCRLGRRLVYHRFGQQYIFVCASRVACFSTFQHLSGYSSGRPSTAATRAPPLPGVERDGHPAHGGPPWRRSRGAAPLCTSLPPTLRARRAAAGRCTCGGCADPAPWPARADARLWRPRRCARAGPGAPRRSGCPADTHFAVGPVSGERGERSMRVQCTNLPAIPRSDAVATLLRSNARALAEGGLSRPSDAAALSDAELRVSAAAPPPTTHTHTLHTRCKAAYLCLCATPPRRPSASCTP